MLNLFVIFSSFLFIYSYGFTDLNLTLSSNPTFLSIISTLQQLVYFQREKSFLVYLLLIIILFSLYYLYLLQAKNHKLNNFPWGKIAVIALLFAFAYPFLSHDIFNYMFHSKILFKYHQNPHIYAPLSYPNDEWIRFMRWVHTPAAYGPINTIIYAPVYLLGLGKFTLTLAAAKLISLSSYLLSIYFIKTIFLLLKKSKREIVSAQLLFALNPFILIETLANGHNDSIMMVLFYLSIIFLLKNSRSKSIIILLLSVGVKLITIVVLPLYLFKDKISNSTFLRLSAILLSAPMLLLLGRFQPWYLIWSIYALILLDSKIPRNIIFMLSIGGLIYYAPFIKEGIWLNTLPFTVTVTVLAPAVYLLATWIRAQLAPKKSR